MYVASCFTDQKRQARNESKKTSNTQQQGKANLQKRKLYKDKSVAQKK